MNTFFRIVWTIFEKDFLTEKRTKESFSAMLVFGILVLVVFNFTVSPGSQEIQDIGAGMLWVAFTFAGTLGLNRAFASENDNGNMQALIMVPVDKGAIYLGKLLSGAMFMFIVELFIIPVFVLFFNVNIWEQLPGLLLISILGTLGFIGTGTVFSAVALNTRMREVLLPVLLFPVTIPMIIAAVEATAVLLRGEPLSGAYDWIKILLGFDVTIIVTSFLTFEYILEE